MFPNQGNILARCHSRETETSWWRNFRRDFHVTPPFLRRLSIEKELEGHSGCVNCLEWNSTGSLLASGSDDFHLIVWDVPKYKVQTRIQTNHEGNIFSVKFLPFSCENMLATCAADTTIRLFDLDRVVEVQTFRCHRRRAKKLAVSKHSPYNLWCGAEDGTVREFDLRAPSHQCASRPTCANVIVNPAAHVSATCEVKSVQLHPLRPEFIAVGVNDEFLRLYDRRMLKCTDTSSSNFTDPSLRNCVSYFTPGHLLSTPGIKMSKRTPYLTTHISFSPDGREILQNLGGEHIYTYDLLHSRKPRGFRTSHVGGKSQKAPLKNGTYNGVSVKKNDVSLTYVERSSGLPSIFGNEGLCPEAISLKGKGNKAFSKCNYFQAVGYYNEAVKLSPNSSVLLANRAAALLQRSWDGDSYAALRDSEEAVRLDPTYSKAFFRQVKCLISMERYIDANNCIESYKETFKEAAESEKVKSTQKTILNFLKKMEREREVDSDDNIPEEKIPRTTPHRSVTSKEEHLQRTNAFDYDKRFVGSCNTTTDIKEANYFGERGEFIMAGSDCGYMFIWDKKTTNLVDAWHGDESIVNCLQAHPSMCMIATSGIDPVVRLWSPSLRKIDADCQSANDSGRDFSDVQGLVHMNQKRMNTDPFEEMLRNMGYMPRRAEDDDGDELEEGVNLVNCRTS